ncbi:hypothetical protein AMTRI_Chr11g94250 [Amborella trichopoda]
MWTFSPPSLRFPPSHPRAVPASASASATTAHTTSTTTHDPTLQIETVIKEDNLPQALRLLSKTHTPLSQRAYHHLIQACAKRRSLHHGLTVHDHLSSHGFEHDPFLATNLIHMYADCHRPDLASLVFSSFSLSSRTLFLWNAMLRCLSLSPETHENALSLFHQMLDNGLPIDQFTYPYAIKACSTRYHVREFHACVVRRGFDLNFYVATTLLDVYARLGLVDYALRVFEGMPVRTVVTWSAVMAMYVCEGQAEEALKMLRIMVLETDGQPNAVTMLSVLQACGALSAPQTGKSIHAYVLRRQLVSITSTNNSLISMYAKVGLLESARLVFDRMHHRNVVSWNAMISAYGLHGLGHESILMFREMIQSRITPNSITFVALLGACSHSALIKEGKAYFESMEHDYSVLRSMEHYACMVDLLGRAGLLDEASRLIETMLFEPGPTVWGALLGACRTHKNASLGERAAHHLFKLEPKKAGNYVLLADIYASLEMWDELDSVKKMLENEDLCKRTGCSWIEVRRSVYSFVSADELNPQIEQVHALLTKISTEMKQSGYVPNTSAVLYELDNEEKERIVLGHSEKLALAFGLINTESGQTLRITKNLRLCEDCHSVTKFVSMFTNREILVRDVNRFHHFRDGVCSCRDYW